MKLVALLLGIVAWLGAAIVAVLVVNAWSDDNQVAAFFPIAAAVAVAWLIGEWVTERVFVSESSEEGRHGSA
jgi:hypothetical protein